MDSATLITIKQGLCPDCMAEGKRTRIKTFQINFEEAMFMCSLCIWPLDSHEDQLIIFNRPLYIPETEDWDSWNWDEEKELEYLKNWNCNYIPVQKVENNPVSSSKKEEINFEVMDWHEPKEHSSNSDDFCDINVNTSIKNDSSSKPMADNTSLSSSLGDSKLSLPSTLSNTKAIDVLDKAKVSCKPKILVTEPKTKMLTSNPKSLCVKKPVFKKQKKAFKKFSFDDLKSKKQSKIEIKQNNVHAVKTENLDNGTKDCSSELPDLKDSVIDDLDFGQFFDSSTLNVKNEFNAVSNKTKRQSVFDSPRRSLSKDSGIVLDDIEIDELIVGDKTKELSKYLSQELNGSFDEQDYELAF